MTEHEGGESHEAAVQGLVRGHEDGQGAGLAPPPRLLQADRPARAPLRVRLLVDLTHHAVRRRLALEAVAGALVGAGVQASGLVPVDATAWFVVGALGLAVVAGRIARRWST